MASLYKKPVTVTDRATGQQVKAKSKKWWGQYKDALGRLRRQPRFMSLRPACKLVAARR